MVVSFDRNLYFVDMVKDQRFGEFDRSFDVVLIKFVPLCVRSLGANICRNARPLRLSRR